MRIFFFFFFFLFFFSLVLYLRISTRRTLIIHHVKDKHIQGTRARRTFDSILMWVWLYCRHNAVVAISPRQFAGPFLLLLWLLLLSWTKWKNKKKNSELIINLKYVYRIYVYHCGIMSKRIIKKIELTKEYEYDVSCVPIGGYRQHETIQ